MPMQHSSYWQPGLGCHNLPMDWFDQFIPATRKKELNAYVYGTVALGGLSLASAFKDARIHLKVPPQEPVPHLEVLQHLLAPALQRRQSLAQRPQPVFANIVACLDRSQCPSLKHTQLINDLGASERGPTCWIWHWRACEFEKAVKHIEREPPLPSGSQYHSVKTLFVTLKEETSPLCGGSDTRTGAATAIAEDAPDYDGPVSAGGEDTVPAWSAARIDVLRSFGALSLAYIQNENINIACSILNGTKASSLHSHLLESRVMFKTTPSNLLLSSWKTNFVDLAHPYIRTSTLWKGYQTWAARFTQAQLENFPTSHGGLLTQSVSRLLECIALRYAITQALLTVVEQGGVIRFGDTTISTASHSAVSAAVGRAYSLETLYSSINSVLDAQLTPTRAVLPFNSLLQELDISNLETLTQPQLLERMRELTDYMPPEEDAEDDRFVTTAALAEGLANGSLSGAEFADYCLNAGYTKAEILACAGSMFEVVLEGGMLDELVHELNGEELEELFALLSVD